MGRMHHDPCPTCVAAPAALANAPSPSPPSAPPPLGTMTPTCCCCCCRCRLQAAAGPPARPITAAPPPPQRGEAITCPICAADVALQDLDSHEAAHDLELQQQQVGRWGGLLASRQPG
jgi:hypothetical protein